jgi:L,D-transpeptidase ErfK/SrfK
MVVRKIILIPALLILVVVLAIMGSAWWVNRPTLPEDSTASLSDSAGRAVPGTPQALRAELRRREKALTRLQPKQKYIVIDCYANTLYLRTEDSVLLTTNCSTGTGSELVDTASGRHWVFATPRGVFRIGQMKAQPWWRKPDWAYIEEGEPVPAANDPDRLDPEMLGAYALAFGDGYFIHGTIYERLLGVSVTHGCVRVGSVDLEKLYKQVSSGTPLYVY